jgi:hypothetical protein
MFLFLEKCYLKCVWILWYKNSRLSLKIVPLQCTFTLTLQCILQSGRYGTSFVLAHVFWSILNFCNVLLTSCVIPVKLWKYILQQRQDDSRAYAPKYMDSGDMTVKLHTFLTSVVDSDEQYSSYSSSTTPSGIKNQMLRLDMCPRRRTWYKVGAEDCDPPRNWVLVI